MPEDRLLTSKKAARLIDVDEDTLDNWRYLGKGPPYIKKGRYIRYWESDIQAWANKDRVIPKGKAKDTP